MINISCYLEIIMKVKIRFSKVNNKNKLIVIETETGKEISDNILNI